MTSVKTWPPRNLANLGPNLPDQIRSNFTSFGPDLGPMWPDLAEFRENVAHARFCLFWPTTAKFGRNLTPRPNMAYSRCKPKRGRCSARATTCRQLSDNCSANVEATSELAGLAEANLTTLSRPKPIAPGTPSCCGQARAEFEKTANSGRCSLKLEPPLANIGPTWPASAQTGPAAVQIGPPSAEVA